MKLWPFFFEKTSASGFGLMRIGWALVVFLFLLFQWSDVASYYSTEGIFPLELRHIILRKEYRFTLLSIITDPNAVFALYLVLLASLLCMAVGLWPRISTLLSVLLLFSFHEGNPLPLGGGDTLLRSIGFFLAISPGISAFSCKRFFLQKRAFERGGKLLPPLRMPIWPYHLLLFQMILLYGTTLWYKLLGTMWLQGTAVDAAFHHPLFFRWPESLAHFLTPLTPFMTSLTLVFLGAWVLLLIPRGLTDLLPLWIPRLPLKRTLLLLGSLFHGGILILLDAGSFAPAVLVSYLGIFDGSDIEALRSWFNSRWATTNYKLQTTNSSKVVVLYDGSCGMCRRSIFVLLLLDHLKRLRPVNFHDAKEKKRSAPDLRFSDLDLAMHVRLPPRGRHAELVEARTYKGFDGFRALTWHLPALWPAIPLLYCPGIPQIGRALYIKIAKRRKRCSHERCST